MLVTKHEQTKIMKSNGGSKLNLSSITIVEFSQNNRELSRGKIEIINI